MVQQTIQFETVSPSEIGSGTITAFLYSGDTLAATLANITENSTLKGRHTGTVDDEAAADYRLVVKFDGYTVSEPDETVTLLLAVGTYVAKRLAALDSSARVKLAAEQPDYHPATTAELEARTILAANYRQNITLRGTSMTEAKAFDLMLAASAGITSQPSGTTEKFKFLDGNDAFTTTFDTNGNRTGVAMA